MASNEPSSSQSNKKGNDGKAPPSEDKEPLVDYSEKFQIEGLKAVIPATNINYVTISGEIIEPERYKAPTKQLSTVKPNDFEKKVFAEDPEKQLYSLLYQAVVNNEVVKLDYYLSNWKTKKLKKVLEHFWNAAKLGHLELLKCFAFHFPKNLKELANFKHSDFDWRTPLMCAAMYGFPQVVKFLLQIGSNPNLSQNGFKNNALHWAAAEDHPYICDLLISNGANLLAQNCSQWTPASQAAASGSTKTLPLLVERSIKLSPVAKGEIKEAAAYSETPEIIKYFDSQK